MARADGGASRILLCLGLLLVATSLCLCASLTRLKALDHFRQSSTLSQGQTEASHLRHGKLLIGQAALGLAKLQTKTTKNPLDVDSDYQSDMGM